MNRIDWAAPSFIIPKKGLRVRFISDSMRIKKQLKSNPHLLPHFKDVLSKLSNFTYATILYLIMGYYNISLLKYIRLYADYHW